MSVAAARFRHEALFYDGEEEFVAHTSRFVRDGIEADEPTLVVVAAPKIARLRESLGDLADRVQFADMDDVGRNPARIIPAWRTFVDEHARPGVRMRGVGEPIHGGRSDDALVECQHHESLLNVAFADSPSWWLLCPYDVAALDAAVVDEARRSHPHVTNGHSPQTSEFRGLGACSEPLAAQLPAAPDDALRLDFHLATLGGVRETISREAASLGLGDGRVADFSLVVHELAANSIRHGGGSGRLLMWAEDEAVVAEVADAGTISDPLVGRVAPRREGLGGRGLWLANQLCDLVQIRTGDHGTTVRVRLASNRA